MIVIERPGPLTTVQDLGRPGWGALGAGPSGAADRGALRRANRLVGNPDDTAGLEVTLGGLVFRVEEAVVVAVAGADCPLSVDDVPMRGESAWPVSPGSRLTVGIARHGVRAYVAVRGGLAVPPVLGSRSTDTLAGLGPPTLRAGDVLPIGWISAPPLPVTLPPRLGPPLPLGPPAGFPGIHRERAVRVLPGPRLEWFGSEALGALCTSTWTVTARSDRVGLRLNGPALRRLVPLELPSEGMVRGAIQVPPDGQPVLLLADHPVTGGYPVIAVVVDADVDVTAQLRPGADLQFSLA